MKYLVRSIKYFLKMAVIFSIVVLILVRLNLVEGDFSTIFVNGYDSYWQIALVLLVFAAIYPKMGYSTRQARLFGSDEEIKRGVLEVMDTLGYRLASESGDEMKFTKRSPLERATRAWEDTLTFKRNIGGYEIEGATKDTLRIISSLEYKFREN